MKNIALVDNHQDIDAGFESFFRKTPFFDFFMKENNGFDFLMKLTRQKKLPDVVFINVSLPVIDGIGLTHYLKYHHPSIKVIGISNVYTEDIVKQMISAGASGYLVRDNLGAYLKVALEDIYNRNFYLDERIGMDEHFKNRLLNYVIDPVEKIHFFGLTERERTFVILNATVLSYEQIARIMFVEPKTLETYFDRVSKKLNTTSRQSLAIFSLQNRLARIAVY